MSNVQLFTIFISVICTFLLFTSSGFRSPRKKLRKKLKQNKYLFETSGFNNNSIIDEIRDKGFLMVIVVVGCSFLIFIILDVIQPRKIKMMNDNQLLFTQSYLPNPDNLNSISEAFKDSLKASDIQIDSGSLYQVNITNLSVFDKRLNPTDEYLLSAAELEKQLIDTSSEINERLNSSLSPFPRDRKKITIYKSNLKKKRILRTPKIGDFYLYIDDTMFIGQGHPAVLIMAARKDSMRRDLFLKKVDYLKDQTAVIVDSIAKSAVINAELLVPGGNEIFNISPLETQHKKINLNKREIVFFEWIVSPLKTGINDVTLRLDAKQKDKYNDNLFLPDKSYTIHALLSPKIGIFDWLSYKAKQYQVLLSIFGGIIAFFAAISFGKRLKGNLTNLIFFQLYKCLVNWVKVWRESRPTAMKVQEYYGLVRVITN